MHLIKIGILTAALVSSFSVSATRYEVACIGGGLITSESTSFHELTQATQ